MEGTWVPPTSLHDPTVLERPDGHLYNTIKNGIRNMPPYGPQIPTEDRWAIVAYVRALQRSQHATMADVPPEVRSRMVGSAPPIPALPEPSR
jgi:mono/diheme cytochrome c family protein